MKLFDPRLTALAACPILDVPPNEDGEPEGAIIFNPHPVITSSDDLVLTHELCHRIAGKWTYDIFLTAILTRDGNELFKWVLNALYDWYHENKHRDESSVISTNLMLLRERYKLDETKDPVLNKLVYLLNNEVELSEGEKLLECTVRDEIDLVVLADKLAQKITKVPRSKACAMLKAGRPGGLLAGGGKNQEVAEMSDYYTMTVSKYYNIIIDLSNLWTCNRYDWCKNYYGEINWANLPLLMLGAELHLPVFRIMSKISLRRNVFIVIDRSGSTCDIKDQIMDTAIILAESLRMLGTPISVMDVGVTDTVINKINEPIDRKWFTPMSNGGTPLGDVLLQINGDDSDSLLIVITDGCPDNWKKVKQALTRFKGRHISCVIGTDYMEYKRNIRNVIPVEPNSIIRSLLANDQQIISKDKKSVRG